MMQDNRSGRSNEDPWHRVNVLVNIGLGVWRYDWRLAVHIPRTVSRRVNDLRNTDPDTYSTLTMCVTPQILVTDSNCQEVEGDKFLPLAT